MEFLISNWPIILILLIAVYFITKLQNDDASLGMTSSELIKLNNAGALVLVDIRNHEMYKSCKIAASINCSDKEDIVRIIKKNHKKQAVLICNRGKTAAELAKRLLNEDNSCKVKYLIGGITAWQAEDLPVLSDDSD